MALAQSDQKNYRQAIVSSTEALEIDKKYYGEDHPLVGLRYSSLSANYREIGEFQKSETAITKGIEIFKANFGEKHDRLVSLFITKGLLYMETNRLPEALETWNESLSIREKAIPAGHPAIAHLYHLRGRTHAMASEWEDAVNDFRVAGATYLNLSLIHI